MNKKFIQIGAVVRAQGIKGLVRVKPFADPETFLDADILYLGKGDSDPVPRKVISSQLHQGAVLIGLEGVKTMTEAEKLVGNQIYADREALPELPEGEYYWFEVLGLEVYTEDGLLLGKIKEILPTGSNDVYVVRKDGKEYLIPAIEDVVREIDLSGGRVIIHPIKGLLGEE